MSFSLDFGFEMATAIAPVDWTLWISFGHPNPLFLFMWFVEDHAAELEYFSCVLLCAFVSLHLTLYNYCASLL
eukprot:m.113158 g.113158  ORF g.113158 m.113158 type:complete len:73 (-) comp28251_c0_seq3:4-222(-)